MKIFHELEDLYSKLDKKYINGNYKKSIEDKINELTETLDKHLNEALLWIDIGVIIDEAKWEGVLFIKQAYHFERDSWLECSVDNKSFELIKLNEKSFSYTTESSIEQLKDACEALTIMLRKTIVQSIKESEIDDQIRDPKSCTKAKRNARRGI